MAWKSSTTVIKVALIILGIAVILMITSYATTYWATASYGHNPVDMRYGIWHECHKNYCRMIMYTDGWWKGTQATITLGMICTVFAFALALMYVFMPGMDEHTFFGVIVGVLGLMAFISLLVGVSIFGGVLPHRFDDYKSTGFSESLSYSFYLAIVSMILVLVGSVFGLLDSCSD